MPSTVRIANCNVSVIGEVKRRTPFDATGFSESIPIDTQMDRTDANREFPPTPLPRPPGQDYP